ncbi:myb family transcription factor EFM-like [Asparagus officinalis]|uniref:myb family transcription factor EFM-like n=1 Tax=Asparagus officinalis TaxID=4686 RepID=UPI00098E28A9|nr:myb family transcription factor EFM-like [Asparagus officinalis]
MASPSELTLDYKPNPNNYPMMQKPLGDQNDQPTQKLEDFLARLEEERLKIEAFKRELPLCMQLLNNGIGILHSHIYIYFICRSPQLISLFYPKKNYLYNLHNLVQLLIETNLTNFFLSIFFLKTAIYIFEFYIYPMHLSSNSSYNNNYGQKPPVLEEFIPITSTGPDKPATTASEKPNWMLSAQLWSPPSDPSPKPIDTNKNRNGGAFLPFSKEKANGNNNNSNKGEKLLTVSPATAAAGSGNRKARRCWSPDLHRRFVNALQMLGGSQVATPKQIRELMKVDGLTNDEVKSHLQKYRLSTTQATPAPTTSARQQPLSYRRRAPSLPAASAGDLSESIDDGDGGEEREVEEEDDEDDNDEEVMEEVKVEDKALVVAVDSNGSGGDVALKF